MAARAGLALTCVLALWQGVVWATGVQAFLLPGPALVAEALWTHRMTILANAGVTAAQLAVGLVLGIALGISTAAQLALSPAARTVLRPLLVGLQAVPVFAIAPLLTLWLGYGPASKIAMVILITYFPVASAFFDGLTRTPQGSTDLARVMGAGDLRTLVWLRVPHAMPSLASGLRLAAVQAPLGAVIGEWVGASEGLGYLMLLANGRAETDLMFAALLVLATGAVALYVAADRAGQWLAVRFGSPAG